MGLDATIFCDCYERGRLREPPPPGCPLRVAEDGDLVCESGDRSVLLAFDRWRESRACEHEDGRLVACWIGNAARVSTLRAALEREGARFPLLLSKVLFSGIHSGDFLPPAEVEAIRDEVRALSALRPPDRRAADAVAVFAGQMRELVDAALRVRKPIVF